MCRSVAAPASLVVVMGTQYFDSSGLGGEDFPVPELLQMLGLASRPLQDDAGIAVIMCHAAKKEYYKKFLFEPLPVESHLDMHLHDHMVRLECSCSCARQWLHCCLAVVDEVSVFIQSGARLTAVLELSP